jgi:site-specific recombinase XerC
MILSHARLPIPTLPLIQNTSSDTEKVNQVNQKLTSGMLDTFLASRRQGMSNHTLLFYQRCLSKAIGIELSPQGISLFLANLKCGNAKHSYFRAIRAFCNWSYKEGLVKENPIDRVDTPIVAKKLLPSITPEQFSLLIEATDNLRDKCIVSLLFDSGLRLSEICNIEANNIDWDSNTLRVVVKGNREAKAVFTPKTATLLKTYL